MNTKILVSFLLTGFFIGVGIVVLSKPSPTGDLGGEIGRVSVVDGVQVVEMQAKGGYFPSSVTLQAGLPTTVRMNSAGTYDCSAALRIPQLDYSVSLPSNGVTEIQIPAQEAGTTLQGLCGMGMYGFKLIFE